MKQWFVIFLIILMNIVACESNEHKWFKAAQQGDKETIASLVKKVNVNVKDDDGRTALHKAVWNKDFLALLIKNGANVNAKDKSGKTPLHLAADGGSDGKMQMDIVDLLIKNGAKITGDNDSTALHLAARIGYIKEVASLIRKGAKVNAKSKDGSTALDLAASNGHKDVVELLITKGIKVKSEAGVSALFGAASNGHSDVVDLLIKRGANLHATDEYGRTILYEAASDGGHKDVVLLLIEKGANVNARTKEGRTVLHGAASGGNDNKSVVELLIQKGAKVNARDNKGETPLHDAARSFYDNGDIVEVLIKNGADVNAKTRTGRTPLHEAVKNLNNKAIEMLIKNGAKFNVKDEKGQTPLDLVEGDWSKLYIATVFGDKEEVTRLVDKGVDINVRYGRITVLHKAAQWDRKGIVELLIRNGAHVNASDGDNDGKTPLDLAKSEEMKQILIKAGGKSGKDLK